jgi:hypothetical protein
VLPWFVSAWAATGPRSNTSARTASSTDAHPGERHEIGVRPDTIDGVELNGAEGVEQRDDAGLSFSERGSQRGGAEEHGAGFIGGERAHGRG